MKHLNLLVCILICPFLGFACDWEITPTTEQIDIRTLLKASPSSIAAVLKAFAAQEKALADYMPPTKEDIKRRLALDDIASKIPTLDLKAPERKPLLQALCQISKDYDRRLESLEREQAKQEEERAFASLTQEELKEIIEQALKTDVDIFGSMHEDRQQFWKEKILLLRTEQVDEEQLIELLELAAQDIENLADSMHSYKQTFPREQTEAAPEALLRPHPKRRHSKPNV